VLPLSPGQACVLELLEVVRQCGTRNTEFSLNLHHDHAAGMCREEKPHDAEPRLRAHGGKHPRIERNVGLFGFRHSCTIEKPAAPS